MIGCVDPRNIGPEVRCTGVPVEHIDVVWPWVEPLLAPAIDIAERNEGERENVHAELMAGRKQLYVGQDHEGHRMALVTCIEDRADGRCCYLAYLGGQKLAAFVSYQRRFEEWARSLGCWCMESSSPKAMLRWMRDWQVIGRDGDLYRLRKELI